MAPISFSRVFGRGLCGGVGVVSVLPVQNASLCDTSMAMDREVAISELKLRGIVPERCIHDQGYHHDPHFEENVERQEGDPRWTWKEPIRAFHTSNFGGIPHYDHGGSMVEVHHRDGIEWHLARVLFSQPYGPVDRLRSTAGHVRDRLDLEMTVTDDLAWHSTNATLCVYTPIRPILFCEFRRTFRYWMLTNVTPTARIRSFAFRDGVLPTGVTPPHAIFFDLLVSANRASVVLGLYHETVDGAWNDVGRGTHGWIEYATFAFLWNAYRASLCRTHILMAVLFVSRLRARVAYRIVSHAPGGEAHLRLVSEWSNMMS